MEEKRRDSIGTPPPPASTADAPTSEQPTSRRRGGAQKRKSASVNSGGSGSASQTTSSKRQAREKPPPVPFPPIHMNGPCTRARVQPYNSSSAYAEVAAVKSEAEAREAAAKMEEMIRANENWQALEAKIEADYAAIRSRDASVHVVPFHAGWFSWTKIHPLEEMMLPSFFNGKLESRTPQIYMDIRNWIMMKFHVNLSEPIELKHLSEITVGELDARQEVMEFLEYWGLINYHPFPKHESSNITVDADADKDEAQKIDSLVEKLYKFETVQSWTPIIPRTNMTVPATSSGVFPESVVADELVRSEEPPVEYHCNSCSADCSRKRYHCQKQADFDLCADCFTSGKFGSDMSPSDFILMEPGEAGGAGGGNWTDQETLLLLEAIELFRDNWSEIAEHVATKTRAQCILHFVQMPIEDVFFNHDDEADDPPKESEALVSISENSAPKTDEDSSITVKEAPQKKESQEGTTDNQDSSCPIPTSKPDEGNALEKSPDAGENLALKALKEAFEAVGSFPIPGEKLCFVEAGNPVMALAAYLVRLVDPNVATAAVHSILKSLSGNSSSEELAARHCFRLEDPPDGIKNLINLEGTATETSEHKAGNKGKQGENQEETPELVVNVNGSHDGTDAKKDSAPVERGEKENFTSEQKPLSAPSSNHADKSNTMKESGEWATHKKAESISSKSPKEQALKDNEDSVVSVSDTKSQSKPVKESEGGASADEVGKSNENQKDENMTAAPEKMGADLLAKSTSMTEKENLADDGEAKKCACEKKETQVTKDNLEFEKLKNAAVTALSGAAVKAKFLADEEEEEILKLTTYIIEKQLYKLETKMAFFQDMDNVLMRVKEQLDRSKQKLFHERAQIIASRFGMSGSARPSPNAPGVPPNRPPFNFPNSAPRPAMGVNSVRPPFPRPMMPPNPTSTTATSATSVQQPN